MTIDEIKKKFSDLSDEELLAYAIEQCEDEGGEWCTIVDDLGYGERSIWGVNKLGAVAITAKRKSKANPKTTWFIIGAIILLIAFAIWYFKFYKK